VTIQDYLPDDNYKPVTPKPSLQQYDNYQIYDSYCTDISYLFNTDDPDLMLNINRYPTDLDISRLFVQRFSVSKILCNFEAIAIAYP
jgi:hypothetical protein